MEDAPLRIILQIAVPISAPGDASVPITGDSAGGAGGGHKKVLIFAGILVVLLTAQS